MRSSTVGAGARAVSLKTRYILTGSVLGRTGLWESHWCDVPAKMRQKVRRADSSMWYASPQGMATLSSNDLQEQAHRQSRVTDVDLLCWGL